MMERLTFLSCPFLLLFLVSSGVGQTRPTSGCSSFRISGPDKAEIDKTIHYTAKVDKLEGQAFYKWTVVGGTIIEGQGTKKIKVRSKSYRVRVSLALSDANPACHAISTTLIKGLPIVPNRPPTAMAVSATEFAVALPCPDGTNACSSNSRAVVELKVQASDPDEDQLVYSWSFTGGRLTGNETASWNLESARPGTYTATVEVSDEGGASAQTTFTATVAACSACERVDPQTAVIFGVITDANGATVSGASVTLAGAANRGPIMTGSDGTYQFRTLPLGQYRVTATHGTLRGTATAGLLGPTDQAEVNIVLKGGT